MEDFEAKLEKVNIVDIYNDVAAIDVSREQLTELCYIFTCRVDLRRGNVVYAVEQKYKEKLATYNPKKRLKWLNINFSHIMPNADEKFCKWQQNHEHKKKLDWLDRKIFALDYIIPLPPLCNNLDDPCYSHSIPAAGRRQSRYSSSTTVNTSLESLQTVIASQPKNTESDISGLICLADMSRSTLECSTEELPPLCMDDPNELNAPAVPPKHLTKRVTFGKVFVQESQEGSSQENGYSMFTQDMRVTSTQEFGGD